MILILDFGSQYTHLIARRARELGVFSEVLAYNSSIEDILKKKPSGIVLSGGPASVVSEDAPFCDDGIFNLGLPVLGVCYGMQLITKVLGGTVVKGNSREYGKSKIFIDTKSQLFHNLSKSFFVWMSHSDRLKKLPNGFVGVAHTENIRYAAIENQSKKLYGVQFHPEVVHTDFGKKILSNFIFRVCGAKKNWNPQLFAEGAIKDIRKTVGRSKVVCGISGGVDSSVAAVLLNKAIGKKLTAIFVDNGLLRQGERQKIEGVFKKRLNFTVRFVNAKNIFLERLKGVLDPEKKRKIIGRTFIDVFESEAKKIKGVEFLAQGTLYPDVIESLSVKGPSATIKSHHNVGGLPEKMGVKLIEPFRYLFKDEVRVIGKELGLLDEIIHRQPFPGPGLAIRIIGEVTEERLEILRKADWILIDEMKKAGYYYKVWQSFAVLVPVKTVGVMGDERTYENVAAIRIVESIDGMTADFVRIPYQILERISTKIVNEVKGINRVVYDITSKPPSTIEWE